MMDLLVILGALTAIVIAGLLLWEVFSPRGLAMSWRTFFLIGYLIFFGTGSMFLAMESFSNRFYIPSPGAIARLCFWVPGFLAVFLITYKFGRRMKRVARVLPSTQLVVSAPMVMITVSISMTLALITTLVPIESYLGLLMAQFRDGWLGAAVGLCTYYMLSRKFNPIAFVMLVVVFPVAAIISTTGTIGRRAVLSMPIMIGWISYFFYVRYLSTKARMLIVTGGLVALMFGLTIFSSFRGQQLDLMANTRMAMVQVRFMQFVKAFTSPKIDRDMIWNLLVTDAPIYTGYLFDMVPDSITPSPFDGAVYLITNPIPRSIWPNKPEGLGTIIQRRLALDFNVGPGVLGHGYYEGLHLGVFAYAVFFGLLCSIIDTAIRQRCNDPLFLIAIGASLGNVIGMARGHTTLFLLLTTSAFFTSMCTFLALRLVAGPVLNTLPPLPHPARKLHPGPTAQFFDEPVASRAEESPAETAEASAWESEPAAAEAYWSDDARDRGAA